MRRGFLAGLFVVCAASAAFAQDSNSKFGITDNSFLIEEAYNQEPGIFQNIFVMSRGRDANWAGSFTQEWPIKSMTHQASFTVPFERSAGSSVFGDVAFNYRYQVSTGEGGAPAFSPRLSVLAPTNSAGVLDDHGLGLEANLPVSAEMGRVFVHGNLGGRFVRETNPLNADRTWTKTPFMGGSVIVAVTPMFNLMAETLVVMQGVPGATHEISTTFAPGFRAGWNLGGKQLVLGVAVPVTRGDSHDNGVLGYFSYELPFARR